MTRNSLDANRAMVSSLAFCIAHALHDPLSLPYVESLANAVDHRALSAVGNVSSPLDLRRSGDFKLQARVRQQQATTRRLLQKAQDHKHKPFYSAVPAVHEASLNAHPPVEGRIVCTFDVAVQDDTRNCKALDGCRGATRERPLAVVGLAAFNRVQVGLRFAGVPNRVVGDELGVTQNQRGVGRGTRGPKRGVCEVVWRHRGPLDERQKAGAVLEVQGLGRREWRIFVGGGHRSGVPDTEVVDLPPLQLGLVARIGGLGKEASAFGVGDEMGTGVRIASKLSATRGPPSGVRRLAAATNNRCADEY